MEPRHILVVDDDEDVRAALAELLEAHGYAVRLAANGREALQKASEQRPVLILLDLNMPVLDGWRTLEELGHNPELRSVPVVVVSGESSPPRGVILIKKPVEAERVLNAVSGVHAK